MKKYITLLTTCIFTCVSADQTPPSFLEVDTDPDDISLPTPSYYEESPAAKEPKEKSNYTSLYVFVGTLVAATAGLLVSKADTGRRATPAQKASPTGNTTTP